MDPKHKIIEIHAHFSDIQKALDKLMGKVASIDRHVEEKSCHARITTHLSVLKNYDPETYPSTDETRKTVRDAIEGLLNLAAASMLATAPARNVRGKRSNASAIPLRKDFSKAPVTHVSGESIEKGPDLNQHAIGAVPEDYHILPFLKKQLLMGSEVRIRLLEDMYTQCGGEKDNFDKLIKDLKSRKIIVVEGNKKTGWVIS